MDEALSNNNTELFIMLSDRCNFSCRHCLTMSSPKANRFKLSAPEIKAIQQQVNTSLEIRIVHFSGGEPSLFIDIIKDIQSGITRKVDYEITTNGWFGVNNPGLLDEIHLSAVTFSYDKYRTEFIKTDTLGLALKHQKELGRKTKLNFTYDSVLDLSLLNGFPKADVDEVRAIKVTQCGRQERVDNTISKANLSELTCPSLTENRRKINYYPNEGYSVCCGPLLFDKLTPSPKLYSEDGSASEIEKLLNNSNFQRQFDNLGLNTDDMSFTSACEACTFLYGTNKHLGGISISDFVKSNESFVTILNQDISPAELEKLNKSFDVSIIFKGQLNQEPQLQNEDDKELKINDANDVEQTFLLSKSIGERTLGNIPENSRVNDIKGFQSYFDRCVFRKIITYQNVPCGLLLISEFDQNPYDNTPSKHIGFYGYSQAHGIEASKSIKNCLNALITKNLGSHTLTGLIAVTNTASLKYFKRMGLQQIGYRINKRIHK